MTSTLFDESGLAAIYPGAWNRVRAAVAAGATSAAVVRAQEPPSAAPGDGIAVVPIHGVISKRGNVFTDVFGGTTIDRLQATFAQLRADRSVRAVVLHVDSPGGGVHGVDETAEQIADLAKRKPVIAFTDGLAASAAYWLISGASRIVATPSAEVGSIGVFAVHFDHSGELDKAGIVPTLVRAGEFKAEANPYQPLSTDDRDAMQSRIDSYYQMFTKRVARGRGVAIDVVRNGFGQGRVVGAQQALDEGMTTDVGGWSDVLRLAANPEQRERVAASAADSLLRLRLQLEDVAL